MLRIPGVQLLFEVGAYPRSQLSHFPAPLREHPDVAQLGAQTAADKDHAKKVENFTS